MGIDYGKKKIGLAISEGEIASPFKVLNCSSLEDALNKILQVIKSEEIDRAIVGMPESGQARNNTKKFLQVLKSHISVLEVEETLSSINARKLMVERGSLSSKRSQEDAISASLILQNYLDNEFKK
ncbi:Holliday junction resolvase RuvX [Candidatus Daviesbacteria bacterium]|nr:Holliday junction resolvase RuvX [Candidatus Daviesbacteria bacterium]